MRHAGDERGQAKPHGSGPVRGVNAEECEPALAGGQVVWRDAEEGGALAKPVLELFKRIVEAFEDFAGTGGRFPARLPHADGQGVGETEAGDFELDAGIAGERRAGGRALADDRAPGQGAAAGSAELNAAGRDLYGGE